MALVVGARLGPYEIVSLKGSVGMGESTPSLRAGGGDPFGRLRAWRAGALRPTQEAADEVLTQRPGFAATRADGRRRLGGGWEAGWRAGGSRNLRREAAEAWNQSLRL